jgi:hypothetical protein
MNPNYEIMLQESNATELIYPTSINDPRYSHLVLDCVLIKLKYIYNIVFGEIVLSLQIVSQYSP